AGIREIELQGAGVERRLQEGLPARTVPEADRLRTLAQIGAEQSPQDAPAHHVLPAVLLEAEAVGARPLVLGEEAAQPRDLGRGGIEVDGPDVDLAGLERQAGVGRARRK